MRILVVGAALLLAACAVFKPKPNMTLADYFAACPNQQSLATTDTLSMHYCPSRPAFYQVFESGKLAYELTQSQLDDLADDAQCTAWGAQRGTPEYIDCRTSLAQQRLQQAQIQAAAAAQQQANSLALMGLGMGLMQQPAANRQFRCTTTQSGVFTNTNCW